MRQQPGAHHVGAPRGEPHPVEHRLLDGHRLLETLLAASTSDPTAGLLLRLEDGLVGGLELLDVGRREVGLLHAPLGGAELGPGRLEPGQGAGGAAALGLEPRLEVVDLALQGHELVGQLGRPLRRDQLDRRRVADGVEQHLDRAGVESRQLVEALLEPFELAGEVGFGGHQLVTVGSGAHGLVERGTGASGLLAAAGVGQRGGGQAQAGRGVGVVVAGPLGRLAEDGERLAGRPLPGTGGVELRDSDPRAWRPGTARWTAGHRRVLDQAGQVGAPDDRVEIGVEAEQLEGLDREVEQHAVGLDQPGQAGIGGVGQGADGVDHPLAGGTVEPGHHRHHRVQVESVARAAIES